LKRRCRYRPSFRLARETNGDFGDLLPCWRDRIRRAHQQGRELDRVVFARTAGQTPG
jgi:hypothetical protein